MKREFTVIVERGEDGYLIATVPELHGCHTQARTLPELLERVEEAVLLYLEVEGAPDATAELIGVHKISVPV